MHISWDVSIGQIAMFVGVIGPLLTVIRWLMVIDSKMDRFMIEHEMLMGDLSKRLGIDIQDLPTRRRTAWRRS